MARFPSFKGAYAVSDIVHPRPNAVNFRGYGSDLSENTGDIFYIGLDNLERIISFKGFLENIAINCVKASAMVESQDKNHAIYKAYNGTLSYNVTLNIPAVTVNESRNNLAKIAELQKLITPFTDHTALSTEFNFTDQKGTKSINNFSVFFKNLINSGLPYNREPSISSYKSLYKHGFECYIEQVNYEPDLDMGFFEFDNYLYPKLIKLNLTLNYNGKLNATKAFSDTVEYKAIRGFKTTGKFIDADTGCFPFLVKAGYGTKESYTIQKMAPSNMSVSRMNAIKDDPTSKESTYIFISMLNSDDDYKRYVVFKPFMEKFNRNLDVTSTVEVPQNADFTHSSNVTFKSMSYDLTFNVPSRSLEEAIKNAAKIQYLLRLFYNKNTTSGNGSISTDENFRKKYLKVYVPYFIEKGGATSKSNSSNFDSMFNNAVPLIMQSLKIDFDENLGFYKSNGKLYPKNMTITMNLIMESSRNISNYKLNKSENGKSNQYTVSKDTSVDLTSASDGTEDGVFLFPFNKRYAKITKKEE